MVLDVSDRTRSDLCHNGASTGDKDAPEFFCNSPGAIYERVSSLSAVCLEQFVYIHMFARRRSRCRLCFIYEHSLL